MGVRYNYEPNQFKIYVPIKDETSLTGKKNFLSGTLGKSEWEDIAGEFLEKAVTKNQWQELEVIRVQEAEMMANAGLLFRCKPFVKDPRWNYEGYVSYGTYQITNEALEAILKKEIKAE